MAPKNKVSLYTKLYNHLFASITGGGLKAGDLLPAESELIAQFKVSRGTVRKAYDMLVSQGLIERRSGLGSFVCEQQKLRTVKVVVPSLYTFDHDFDPLNYELKLETLNGILNRAPEYGYIIEVTNYGTDLLKNHKDGVGYIILDSFQELVDALNEREIPYAFFNLAGILPRVRNGVELNLDACFNDCFEYLHRSGHRKIGYISGTGDPFHNKYSALGKKMFDVFVEEPSVGSIVEGYLAAERIWQNRSDLTAFFCRSDLRALGLLRFLNENGTRVPEDVSVLGFDNIRQAADVGLSSYSSPRFEIGRILVDLYHDAEENGIFKVETVTGSVVERKTFRNTEIY